MAALPALQPNAALTAATELANQLFGDVEKPIAKEELYETIANNFDDYYHKSNTQEWVNLLKTIDDLAIEWKKDQDNITKDQIPVKIRDVAILFYKRDAALNDLPIIIKEFDGAIQKLGEIQKLAQESLNIFRKMHVVDMTEIKKKYLEVVSAKITAERNKATLESLQRKLDPAYQGLKIVLQPAAYKHEGLALRDTGKGILSSSPTVDRLRDELIGKDGTIKETAEKEIKEEHDKRVNAQK